ncbi:hypothetical protein [Candidatus Pelagibacter sp. HIMB123]|uniref:hypothetical protein n=1 Tax=Candidatus Pelagibacter sp. HIMB123 TaxID=3415413 RepID=UPI003F83CE20
MKKIFLINILVFFCSILFIYVILEITNIFVSGPPRYYELVYNLEKGDLREKKERLVYYKKNINLNEESNFSQYEINSYDSSDFSGPIVNANCGSLESGLHELYFKTDKNGFRENKDNLYNNTDIVLIGDSFTMSICENKPLDLKSQLIKLNKNLSYLNLGIHGVNYVKQLSVLANITENTNFDTLIWFFYEGNDYEDNISNYNSYNNLKRYQSHSKVDEINYFVDKKFKISLFYKLKVLLAEKVNGISSLVKYFKKYEILLDKDDYNKALQISQKYLDKKNIKNRYIYYIPSWQRLTNYKSKKYGLYNNNPQIKQLNHLKKTVKNVSEKNGFVFIDGEEIFINRVNPLNVFHYELNTHFNRLGYKILAEDIYNKIVKKLN